jgi:hypothetical protein
MVLRSTFWIEHTEFQVGTMRAFDGFVRFSATENSDATGREPVA